MRKGALRRVEKTKYPDNFSSFRFLLLTLTRYSDIFLLHEPDNCVARKQNSSRSPQMIATQIAPKGRQVLNADQRASLVSHLTHQRNCLADRDYMGVDSVRRLKALNKDNGKIVVRLVRGWF